MTDEVPLSDPRSLSLTADLVVSYVAHNHLPPADLPGLVTFIHGALNSLASAHPAHPTEELPTAVEIRKSVRHDALISFLNGRPYKILTRHLKVHGLDPASYRKRFGLPSDYPMVAPFYSETRSSLAKSYGLGRRRQ